MDAFNSSILRTTTRLLHQVEKVSYDILHSMWSSSDPGKICSRGVPDVRSITYSPARVSAVNPILRQQCAIAKVLHSWMHIANALAENL